MSELAEVLELLQRHEPRFRTARVLGHEWRHHARLHEAFVRDRPKGSDVVAAVPITSEAEAPEESDEVWRMWVQPPDRMRVEFAVGDEMVSAVFRGDTWWSWSPSQGARTNGGRTNTCHGIGPGEGLMDPSVILPAVEFEVLGHGEVLGRRVHRVRAVPVRSDEFGRLLALHLLGLGADEYELLVDAERGVLLRSEARLRGQAFRVLEITELGLDEDLPDGTFTLEVPDGEVFEDFAPTHRASLAELPSLVDFTVYAPEPGPRRAPHVTINNPDRRRGTPGWVTLSYMVPKADGEFGNLWIQESADPRPPFQANLPGDVWREVGEFSVGEDKSAGYLRCKVRLVRAGTHIQLESTALSTNQLLELAARLVPLPTNPPSPPPEPAT